MGLLVPEWVFDGFILDLLFNKENDFDKIIEKIVPDLIVLDDSDYKSIMLHLEKKYDILRKGYNWFADYHFAKYRHETLELYSKIVAVFYEIEYSERFKRFSVRSEHCLIVDRVSAVVFACIIGIVYGGI